MTSVCVLRPAQPTDAGAVGAILSSFAEETPWMPRLHSRAEDIGFAGDMIDRRWVTVACQDRCVAGFISRDDDHIHALYVAPTERGQGIGSLLIAAAQQSRQSLSLWTFQANLRAQSFYRRHGFIECQRTDGVANDEGLPDIEFVWKRS